MNTGIKHIIRTGSALLLLALAASAPGATGAEPWLADLGSDVAMLDYHLRLEGARNTWVPCRLLWNYKDSASYTELAFSVPPRTAGDFQLGTDIKYELRQRTQGRDTLLAAGDFSSAYTGEGLSASLRVDGDFALVDLGCRKAELSLPVPFDRIDAARIGYSSQVPLKELANHVMVSHRQPGRRAAFESVDSLTARIKASTDPAVAFWHYLDRDTDIASTTAPGHYTLATVPEPDGSYSIVYISGAPAYAAGWKPLDIKGRLRPTIFAGHFDLEWVDAEGNTHTDETSATMLLNNTILRLDFPLYKSSFRFSRAESR